MNKALLIRPRKPLLMGFANKNDNIDPFRKRVQAWGVPLKASLGLLILTFLSNNLYAIGYGHDNGHHRHGDKHHQHSKHKQHYKKHKKQKNHHHTKSKHQQKRHKAHITTEVPKLPAQTKNITVKVKTVKVKTVEPVPAKPVIEVQPKPSSIKQPTASPTQTVSNNSINTPGTVNTKHTTTKTVESKTTAKESSQSGQTKTPTQTETVVVEQNQFESQNNPAETIHFDDSGLFAFRDTPKDSPKSVTDKIVVTETKVNKSAPIQNTTPIQNTIVVTKPVVPVSKVSIPTNTKVESPTPTLSKPEVNTVSIQQPIVGRGSQSQPVSSLNLGTQQQPKFKFNARRGQTNEELESSETGSAGHTVSYQKVAYLDVHSMSEKHNLFGKIGTGIGLSIGQCEEIEGCMPNLDKQQLNKLKTDLNDQKAKLELMIQNQEGDFTKTQSALVAVNYKLDTINKYQQQLSEFELAEKQNQMAMEQLSRPEPIPPINESPAKQTGHARYNPADFDTSIFEDFDQLIADDI